MIYLTLILYGKVVEIYIHSLSPFQIRMYLEKILIEIFMQNGNYYLKDFTRDHDNKLTYMRSMLGKCLESFLLLLNNTVD